MALRRNQKIAFVLLFLILLFYYFHPAYVYAKSQAKDTMTSTTTLFINGTYAIPMPCMIQRSIEWIPLWYVSKALRIALGVRSEWHDGQWLFDTDYELSAADTEQRNPTSDLRVFIQGKRAYECKAEVATDPWGHKSTTFIKLVDMTRILEIMNIRLVKDGEFLSITKTVPVSIENVISEGSNGFLIITTPKFIYSDVVISHHF
ncbi:hypothetical protein, partial [Alicyclobacillus sendaiensis]|uniref:hypothetical protein n=1 Tax=Alicyclobacillus sendaiensis TaxID=192387 RepID=UPI0026F4455A